MDLQAPDREELRHLLLRWQRGEITFYQAVEEAEAIEDRVWQGVDVIEFPPNDPREVPTEVVGLLSMGYVQPLFSEEIPELLTYLDTAPGDEANAIQRLSAALNKLSAQERIERAQKLYESQPTAG